MTTERTLEPSNTTRELATTNNEVSLVGDVQTELLFPGGTTDNETENTKITLEIAELPVRDIAIIPGHARREVGSVDDLKGFFSKGRECKPISVVISPEGEAFTFDGGRRLEAYIQLKKESINCIVFHGLTMEEAVRRSLRENLHRRSLSPIDIAVAIKKEQQKGLSLRDIEVKLHYGSYANLSNYTKLLGLPETIQNKIHEGKLKTGLAHTLFDLPSSEDQEKMADRIICEDLSIKKTRELINRIYGRSSKPYVESEANITTEYPGIIIRRQFKTPEEEPKSLDLGFTFLPMQDVKTNTKGELASSISPSLEIIKDASKKLKAGTIFGFAFPDKYSDNSSKTNRLIGNLIHSVLTNSRYTFMGRILNLINDEENYQKYLEKIFDSSHADYQIYDANLLDIHIYIKSGDKSPIPDATIKKSRLSDEELTKLIRPTWSYDLQEYGGFEGVRLEIAKNFIKLFSHVGESVFDPFGTNLSVIKAALELGRVPTCYINESHISRDELDAVFTPTTKSRATGAKKTGDINSTLQSAKKLAAMSVSESELITRQLPPFTDSATA